MIKVIFSFDDGSAYDVRTADMLNAYGFDAIFFIPVNWQRYLLDKHIDPLTPDNVTELSKRFEIGSHGVQHLLLTQVSDESKTREIEDSYKWWNENGYKVNSFCYPRGYYDEDIKKKVKNAGYKWARTVKVGNLEVAKDPYETETTVHVGYDRNEYGTDWYTYAKDKVKEAVKRHLEGEDIVYHAWGHSEEIQRYQQWDRLGRFMSFLKEQLDDSYS